MKPFFRIILLSVFLVGIASCGDDDEAKDIALEVNYANLNGSWRLTNWNGEEVDENQSYVYIKFNRKERTYVMYEKVSTGKAWKRTGDFLIENEEKLGYILSGTYDNGLGNWAQEYVVTDFTETSMVWTVKGNADDVSVYTRCNEIPTDIEAGTHRL